MNDARRCRAKCNATGQQCRKAAILGGTVCQKHGGGAPQVKAAARERLLDIIDPDRVFREMARIGFADTTAIFDDDGKVKPLSEWPKNLKRAVASFEVLRTNLNPNDGKFDDVLRVKFWDKTKALEQMANVLKMYEERVKHEGEITFRWDDGKRA